jgi:phospholipid/cholesterol/gamma-HCH transport system substrate-binding protein
MRDRLAFKVGVATFLMTIAIGSLVIWKSGIIFRASGYALFGEFQSINGLLNGAQVRYRGYKVGKVANVMPDPKNIMVKFYVKSEVNVPEDSYLRVVFDGLIGEKYIDIRPNPDSKKMLPPGSVIKGYATSSLADFVDVGTKNLENTKMILETIKNIMTDNSVGGTINSMFTQINKITQDLGGIVKEIRLFSETDALKEILVGFKQATETLNKMTDDLSENFLNKDTAKNMNAILENLAEFTEDLKGALKDTDVDSTSTKNRQSQVQLKSPIKFVKSLSRLKIKPEINFQYWTQDNLATYLGNLDFFINDYYIRASIGDRLGESQLLNFQYGNYLSRDFRVRMGLFYTNPGVGFDYQILDKLNISLDAYNLNELELDILGRYHLFPETLDILVGLRKNQKDSAYNNISLGVSYKP